jgi:hypothetical protein
LGLRARSLRLSGISSTTVSQLMCREQGYKSTRCDEWDQGSGTSDAT